ncbi:uncharacterized protein HMPREF1541_05966 [Cyphellophora europaea CBS 101466]|uniref:Glycosyl transferase CAP10 domain-containing protein n=1 Tax=Cyphellophora europaea (strain CBS 101466) TaxID=1220924 RepID=W2RTT9_CYPE1|nr:uncharacterized protein HMPREF1541_05966 [Cyphellophora europaea CBS 101466]ETN39740.1 hypothetical protein HMPREF1541_05966 [Cyphellophora europaea CBS 101466]
MARTTISRSAPYIAVFLVCFIWYNFQLHPFASINPWQRPIRDSAQEPFLANSSDLPSGGRLATAEYAEDGQLRLVADTSNSASIDSLIKNAGSQFETLLRERSSTLEDAARAYRERRGRHPPPGFDQWYKYAHENGAIIVEDFWDQIYEDLEPFWAVNPSLIHSQARKLGMAVEIKDGRANATTDWFWHTIWAKMFAEVSRHLPDMVVPMNPMDEPRVMVPWEKMSELMAEAQSTKEWLPVGQMRRRVRGWGMETEEEDEEDSDLMWHDSPPFSYARAACPPESPLRRRTESTTPQMLTEEIMLHARQRTHDPDLQSYTNPSFVTNFTESTSPCNEPAIQYYHAALTDPLTASTSTDLLPLFGGSKFATVNNDILLPAPMYWNEEERFMEDDPWEWNAKTDSVIWRGTATGGWNKPNTWTRFHRHRFVALVNGTKYESAHQRASRADDIFSPLWHLSAVSPLKPALQPHLSAYLKHHVDAAFTDLFCDDHDDTKPDDRPYGSCWYTSPHYDVVPGQRLSVQYQSKYLPDIDGNSFSGRYRAFLLSNSLPIKATLYREWHDARLVPWKHFVPMNNRFDDFYRLMEYFAGCSAEICGQDVKGHDAEAEAIAKAGKEWAQKALRKVDMQIYVFRLLLEWGRVTDKDRRKLGWTDDILKRTKATEER